MNWPGGCQTTSNEARNRQRRRAPHQDGKKGRTGRHSPSPRKARSHPKPCGGEKRQTHRRNVHGQQGSYGHRVFDTDEQVVVGRIRDRRGAQTLAPAAAPRKLHVEHHHKKPNKSAPPPEAHAIRVRVISQTPSFTYQKPSPDCQLDTGV